MACERRSILLTGFGPFPGVPQNATSVLVPRLAEAARAELPGLDVAWDILATEWLAGTERLVAVLDERQPALALHFGVSERAQGFVIERQARNVCAPMADACGAL